MKTTDSALPQPLVAPPTLDLLVVVVDSYRCGLPLAAVREVHAAVEVAPLPDAPDVVVGLVNVRGELLPVLSLRRRLGLPPRGLAPDDRLLVLTAERPLAVLVDDAVDVMRVDVAQVDEAVTAGAATTHSRGAVALSDGLLVLTDPVMFLSGHEHDLLVRAMSAAIG